MDYYGLDWENKHNLYNTVSVGTGGTIYERRA